jgi:hypothetical protein
MGPRTYITRPTILCAAVLVAATWAGGGERQYLSGWPVVGGSYHDSSPAVADVDGDGRREVAIASWDGKINLFNARGQLVPGFPVSTGAQSGERNSPALADLDGDKMLEVIYASADGRVYVVNGRGSPVPGWPKDIGAETAGPVVQEFTNYRGLEVFAAAGADIFGLHENGSRIGGWPVKIGSSPTAPAVGDLDGDRRPEVVVAADRTVYAYTTSGSPVSGWPVALDGKVAGAPVLADVDGDGRTEVLVGTSAGSAYLLDDAGKVRPGWPQSLGPKPLTAPAAVGDVEGQGELTLVFVAGAAHVGNATLAAFGADGRPRPGFPKQINRTVAAAPLIVDADGDGIAEILLATYDGSLLAFEHNGALTDGYPLKLHGQGITSTPAAADLDDDGFMDLIVASQNGYVEAFRMDAAYDPSANPWPMYGGNRWRTGKYIGTAGKRQMFELSARGGGITIRWKADQNSGRLGWAILKGVKDAVGENVVYFELAYVDEQPTSSYSYRDENVESGVIYYYKLEERLSSGASYTYGPKAIRATGGSAAKVRSAISNCYPNPFTSVVSIAYEVAATDDRETRTTIAIYDISGKLIRTLVNEVRPAGDNVVEWDGTDSRGVPVASGVYLASLRVGEGAPPSTKTLVLIR